MALALRLSFRVAGSIASVCSLFAACGETPAPPPLPKTKLAIRVIDAATAAPIEGAEVVLTEEGKTRRADAAGKIDVELKPGAYRYRAQALGHVSAPRPGYRARLEVITATTTTVLIRLEPRPGAPGNATLAGRVTQGGAPVSGALVVAVSAQSFFSYTDGSGAYQIPGVAPNLYQVRALLARRTSAGGGRANVLIAAGDNKSDLNIDLVDDLGATLSGQLQGSLRTGTSTITLIEENTGAVVPGLSTRADFGTQYSIAGIPVGTYRIAAALEDDGITYDPQWLLDRGLPMVTVDNASPKMIDLKFSSNAIRGIMPATTSTVVAPVVFRWPSVQDADFYVIEVRDVMGQLLWGGFDSQRRARDPITGRTMVTFGGPQPLMPGALYSWRVFSAKYVVTGQQFNLISVSEELGGEFRVAR